MKHYLRFVAGVLVSTLVLFCWSAVSQNLPWGVPSVKNYSTITVEEKTRTFQAPDLVYLPAYSLTTTQFDSLLVNEVNTLETDKTFSWIVTKSADYYQPEHYLFRALLTQFFVGLLLTLLAVITTQLSFKQRILLLLVVAAAGSIATYGELWNWWGLTVLYALGVSINLMIGWLLNGSILFRFLFKSNG